MLHRDGSVCKIGNFGQRKLIGSRCLIQRHLTANHRNITVGIAFFPHQNGNPRRRLLTFVIHALRGGEKDVSFLPVIAFLFFAVQRQKLCGGIQLGSGFVAKITR